MKSALLKLLSSILAISLPTALPAQTGKIVAPQIRVTSQSWGSTAKNGHSGTQSATALTTASTSNVAITFPGPVSGEAPPDSEVAAGPNAIVAVVNGAIAIYSFSGALLSSTSLDSFLGASGSFDPQLFYDLNNNRFIVTAIDNNSTGGNLYIAVSQTSDPTGGWFKYGINYDGRNSTSGEAAKPDRDIVGISNSALYVNNNAIGMSTGSVEDWLTVISPLSALLSGSSTFTLTRFYAPTSSSGSKAFYIQPARTYGTSQEEYLLTYDNGSFSQLSLFTINTTGTPTLSKSTVPVPAFTPPPDAVQPNSTQTLDSGSYILGNVVFRNGSLWTAHAVGDSTGTYPVVRWYQIDPVNALLQQSGTISGYGEAFMPAVSVLSNSDMFLTFNTGSTSQFVSAAYAFRLATDPANTISSWGVYAQGQGVVGNGGNPNRWGDYSGASPAVDDSGTWGMTQSTTAGNTWDVEIAKIVPGAVSGGCSAPSADRTIHICSPAANSTVSSPVTVSATAADSRPVTQMQIWVDYKEVYSAANVRTISTSLSLGAGSHRLVVQAVDAAGSFKQVETITVGGSSSCSPSTVNPSVTICQPANNATVSSPVKITALTTDSHTVTSISVWVDYVKQYQAAASSVNTSIAMGSGTHRITVLAQDNAGQTSKQTVYAKVP